MSDLTETLVVENRRLQQEILDLRARIHALETSRWYRMNPRRLLPHKPRHGEARPAPVTDTTAQTTVDDETAQRFRAEVLERGDFTEDWFLRAASWNRIYAELEGRAARVLEIGSFEGLSACFILWRLADSTVTCVDTFAGGIEQVGAELGDLERRFDTNVSLVDGSRVRKLVGDSKRVLLDLAGEGAQFDLIYVDGSHMGLDVLADAALSWPLLVPGGFLVFDDYLWTTLGDDPLLRPGRAVDTFLALVEGKYERLFSNRQVGIRKLASARSAAPPLHSSA